MSGEAGAKHQAVQIAAKLQRHRAEVQHRLEQLDSTTRLKVGPTFLSHRGLLREGLPHMKGQE